MTLNCAIYCTVIDNFGDVGVCWRLARQLAEEYQLEVTLWVDDLVSFAKLAPHLDPQLHLQKLDKVTVSLWHPDVDPTPQAPLDLIIEGFGCRLPDQVLAIMVNQAQNGHAPLWINLEYLSAEPWINDCHAMQSTHPFAGLIQYFWFPGFTSESGGLLREADLIQRRIRYQADTQAQIEFWARLGIYDPEKFQRHISLFAYENPQITPLLNSLTIAPEPMLLLVPHSKALTMVEQWAQRPLVVGDRYQHGNLTIVVLPFLSHDDYDHLLWSCDLNIVRGEDSLVRAHWAAKPLLWHIYPQSEDAHLTKLDAYLELAQQDNTASSSWQDAMQRWNTPTLKPDSDPVHAWSTLLSDLPHWAENTSSWQSQLACQTDLTQRLMAFIAQKRNLPTSSR